MRWLAMVSLPLSGGRASWIYASSCHRSNVRFRPRHGVSSRAGRVQRRPGAQVDDAHRFIELMPLAPQRSRQCADGSPRFRRRVDYRRAANVDDVVEAHAFLRRQGVDVSGVEDYRWAILFSSPTPTATAGRSTAQCLPGRPPHPFPFDSSALQRLAHTTHHWFTGRPSCGGAGCPTRKGHRDGG